MQNFISTHSYTAVLKPTSPRSKSFSKPCKEKKNEEHILFSLLEKRFEISFDLNLLRLGYNSSEQVTIVKYILHSQQRAQLHPF